MAVIVPGEPPAAAQRCAGGSFVPDWHQSRTVAAVTPSGRSGHPSMPRPLLRGSCGRTAGAARAGSPCGHAPLSSDVSQEPHPATFVDMRCQGVPGRDMAFVCDKKLRLNRRHLSAIVCPRPATGDNGGPVRKGEMG